MHIFSLLAVTFAAFAASQQKIRSDPLTHGPALEVVHLYNDQWPTGIAVSANGRKFSNYPPALDAGNTNSGSNNRFTIGELLPNNTERAWPSVKINSPPGGAINYTTSPPTGANYRDYLIGSQSIVIDEQDYAWILDTGRAIDPRSGDMVESVDGGPKLLRVSLTNDTVVKNIVFNSSVVFSDSYLNDVRFDLRTNLSGIKGNQGVAYITDSGTNGRGGLITVDLGTGEAWRHLTQDPRVHSEAPFVAYVYGTPFYGLQGPGAPYAGIGFGSDGIALGADGKDLYWSSVASRNLYSIPTERLRDYSLSSEVAAQGAVQCMSPPCNDRRGGSLTPFRNAVRTMKGVSDGLETDSQGFIYGGNVEQSSVVFFNPKNSSTSVFVRDPRINWVDTSKSCCITSRRAGLTCLQ